jgi:hypothetical protein
MARSNTLVPDTAPTIFGATSTDGSPVTITLPGQGISQPGYYNQGLDTVPIFTGNQGPRGWPASVAMAPVNRPFAAGETITLVDSTGAVSAVRSAANNTSAIAYLAPGHTFTASASGWTGGGFSVRFIGQNAAQPMMPSSLGYTPG